MIKRVKQFRNYVRHYGKQIRTYTSHNDQVGDDVCDTDYVNSKMITENVNSILLSTLDMN